MCQGAEATLGLCFPVNFPPASKGLGAGIPAQKTKALASSIVNFAFEITLLTLQ